MAAGKKTGGRQRGTPNKATARREREVARMGQTPLDYMLRVMRDSRASGDRRDKMAVAAAPYVHPKLANIQHIGRNGGPIQTVDLKQMSGDDLDRLEALLGPLAGAASDQHLVATVPQPSYRKLKRVAISSAFTVRRSIVEGRASDCTDKSTAVSPLGICTDWTTVKPSFAEFAESSKIPDFEPMKRRSIERTAEAQSPFRRKLESTSASAVRSAFSRVSSPR